MKWKESTVRNCGIIAGLTGLVLSGVTGYMLVTRDLWGNETRLFFFGFWLMMTGALCMRKTFRKQIHYFLMSTLGGLLISIGFPPSPLLPLVLCALVPLFWLESEWYRRRINRGWFLFYTFNFFLIWNIWTTFWIANTAFMPGITGMLINTLLMTAVVGWISWVHRAARIEWYFNLIFFGGWLTFEFIHLRWELSWPWLNLGNALASWPILAQWYEYTGTLGGSLWILIVNYQIYRLLRQHGFHSRILRWKRIYPLAAWITLPVMASFFIYFTTPVGDPDVQVVVINPNIEPHFEKFTQDPASRWAVYEKLLDEALESDPELIILPETVFDRVNVDDIALNPYVHRIEEMMDARGSHTRVLLGVAGFKIFGPDEAPDRSSIRSSTGQDGNEFKWEVYNSAILLGNDTIPLYHKQKLVPGAEIFPYRNLLFFLNPIVDRLGGSIEGYGRINSQDVFEFGSVRIAPVICYESIYGEYMRKYIAQGANLIGVITNDGWWNNTAGHRQHYEFAALRAIENRRCVVRSANMGLCGAFDVRGNELVVPNRYGEEVVLPVEVSLHEELTFYALWGDYLGRFAIFLMVFFSLKAVVNSLLHRKRN